MLQKQSFKKEELALSENYKHYIRADESNVIIDGYSEWQSDKRVEDEIQLSGEFSRNFTINLLTERLQFKYKLVDGAIVARTQLELDDEWNMRPPEPPTIEQQLSDLQDVVNVLLMGGI